MQNKQPNILFILIDDLGWRDLTCYGSTFYETPNIDRLAKQGLLFSDAYASCPVCSPTRASILTGKYPATVGITQFITGHGIGKLCDVPYFDRLPRSEKTLAKTLRQKGNYQTWHVGKWHLGEGTSDPQSHGFDVNIAGCEWGLPFNGFFSPYGMPHLEDGPDGEYLTDRLTDEAISLIENAEDRPFFLHMSHYAVHTPIQAPPDLVEKYQRKADEMGLNQKEAIETLDLKLPCLPAHFPEDAVPNLNRRRFQSDPGYAAMVENLDWNIGRLLQALDDQGKSEDTLVIFTSDNGGLSTEGRAPTCNAPLHQGKGWMYEGGTREPLIIRWPGVIEAGTTTDALVTSPDFYPTILEASGLDPEPAQHVDGKSFMAVLRGEPFERGPIFWHYPHYSNQGGSPGCSIRDGDWKLIEFFEDNHLELYNLRDDISESNNLTDSEPGTTARLKNRLDAWKAEVHALIPRRNPNWS